MTTKRQAGTEAFFRRCCGMLLALCLLFCVGCREDAGKTAASESSTVRIVSLAPSLTEILFELGLGDSMVADTAYCVTPEAAKSLPKVGAWTDVNVEQVLSFKPTHVCMAETHPKRDSFETVGAGVVAVKGQTLEDVLESIGQLGETFGREAKARELISGIRRRMEVLRHKESGRRPLRTLVIISRNRGEGNLRNMIVAGDDGYFSELLKLAGGEMVPSGLGVAYPSMSMEGVAALNPELIVEIAPDVSGEKTSSVVADWKHCLPDVDAVKAGRILVFTESWASVPGLRSVLFAERLSEQVEKLRGNQP